MFYLIFPLLAVFIRSFKRIFLFIFVSYLIMLAGIFYGPTLYPEISIDARTRFLYFWPPNHLIVFGLGFLLYRSIKSEILKTVIIRSSMNADRATAILAILLISIQFYDTSAFPTAAAFFPIHVILSVIFSAWALFIIVKPTNFLVNNIIVYIGQKSFSIYLIHFAALASTNFLLNKIWPFSLNGVYSIPYAAALFFVALFLSYQTARFTYRFIEVPFIFFGRRLAEKSFLLSRISSIRYQSNRFN